MKLAIRPERAGILALLLAAGAAHAAPQTGEEEVKSAFLYNFARFIEWPAAAFADERAPFVVGVLGKDGLGEALDRTLKGKTANGRSFAVRRSESVDDLRGCHLLFVPDSRKDDWDAVLSSLRGRPILLVGDSNGFAASGGSVNFILEDRKVRFEINPDAAARAGLKVSSKLLQVGKVVRDR
jgi:hypothetical protein